MGRRIVRQMDELVREAEAAGSDDARRKAYAACKATSRGSRVPLDERSGQGTE